MDFLLPESTEQYRKELARWTDRRDIKPGFDKVEWVQFSDRGLLVDQPGETPLDTAVAFTEVARKGLPGPLLEARLASATGDDELRKLLEGGAVVSACMGRPQVDGPVPVGWGAVADVVVDLSSGGVLARGRLEKLATSYLHPHGWWEDGGHVAELSLDQQVMSWTLCGALLTGLAAGAVNLTRDYVAQRVQFGRPIGSFQAVQFPLAEAKVAAEGLRLATIDAAWRVTERLSSATTAAALLAINSVRLTKQVGDICHHAFGAMGLTNEAFLNELTWGMRWLRDLQGVSKARKVILAGRARFASPPSLVLQGFDFAKVG
jgi:Acyl-CoA dehydrogenase, C-terminal domain